MAPYPESESMAIKRMKVAIKKRNWELFEQGIQKVKAMHETGQRWSSAVQWQELMAKAESEYIPPELWDKFSELIKNILKNIDSQQVKTPFMVYEEQPEEIETLSHSQVAIFFNQPIEPVHAATVKKHRISLNNLMYNNNKYEPEPGWFEDLSRLINNLDKPNSNLTGFLSIMATAKEPGAIISSSYDTNIVKNLVKSNIDFSIPDVKMPLNQEKCWELYPLGGLACCFICSSCGHRMLRTDFSLKTIVGSCSRCANPTYPDILDISGEKPEVNPKIWYQAFNKLANAETLVLINPPSYNEQPMVRDLIKDAASVSKAGKIYIITSRNEIGLWWKNKFMKLLPDAEIRTDFPNITALLDTFKDGTDSPDDHEQLEVRNELTIGEAIDESKDEEIKAFEKDIMEEISRLQTGL